MSPFRVIAERRRQRRIAEIREAVVEALRQTGNTKVEVRLAGRDIIRAVRDENRKRGRGDGDMSA